MCHCEMPESCVIRLDDVRDNRFSKKREPWDGQALPGWGEVWVILSQLTTGHFWEDPVHSDNQVSIPTDNLLVEIWEWNADVE